MINVLNVSAMGKSYDIDFASLSSLPLVIKSLFKDSKVLIVVDSNVSKTAHLKAVIGGLQRAGITHYVEVVRAGEESKSIMVCKRLYNVLSSYDMTRSDVIIAFGGGVVGDLTGFTAATYLRGVPFIQVPTTLLAQVDSAVGGKVGINIDAGKNLVGAFYQPDYVLIDTACLGTLPKDEFNGGMAEVIKYGAIHDVNLFNKLKNNIIKKSSSSELQSLIYRCCEIKAGYVEEDPYDRGARMELNFGHTFGHAVENALGYGKIHHGEGVAIGMIFSAMWGESLGITKRGVTKELRDVLNLYFTDLSIPEGVYDKLLNSMTLDKKNMNGKLNFIFIEEVGKAVRKPVCLSDLFDYLKKIY